MSLDDGVPWHVAAILEKRQEDVTEPEWRVMARAQEAAERAAAARENAELLELESPEAEAARWSTRTRQSAREREQVHYTEPHWGYPA